MPADEEHKIEDVEMMVEEPGEVIPPENQKVYVPGISRPLRDGEELDYDPDAYRMFHTFATELPCLSFDVIRDTLGENRESYPQECYLIGGTQAEKVKDNQLVVMHLSNMKAIEHKTEEEEEDDEKSSSSSSDDDDEDEAQASRRRVGGRANAAASKPKPLSAKARARLPIMRAVIIPHYGDVNRVKTNTIGPTPVAAVWNDNAKGRVQIWSLANSLERLAALSTDYAMTNVRMTTEKPLYSFIGHNASGYALGWSPLRVGALASGDDNKKIFHWNMSEAGAWTVDQRPLVGHEASVEDLHWSPVEEPLLVSCSADASIRLWDVRVPDAHACVHTVKDAHDGDVNVLSWNANEPLVVSGGDDGALKIWSLKTIQYNQSIAQFHHHRAPITSVEWSPFDTTTFMASGEDNQITMWDLALEADDQDEEAAARPVVSAVGDANAQPPKDPAVAKIPPQLLFVHMGANEVKEIHWHQQITGLAISTALDGFHAFRTINI